jgi:PKD repeat protein
MVHSSMRMFVLFSLLLFLASPAFAQHNHLRCGTPEPEDTPEFRVQGEAMAKQIQAMRERWAARKRAELPYPTASEYVIPMVVHVIYGDGDRRRDSLSAQQVVSQLIELFNDFRNVPGTRGFSMAGVDTRIEFSLATRRPDGSTTNPDGSPFNGIVYYYGPEYVNFRRNDHNDIVKGSFARQWDPERYMNIWLVNSIVGSRPEDRLGGYAHFPDWQPIIPNDGCVIINSTWGTVGTSTSYDATATHELGHIFHVYHPFQGGCGTSNCQNSGDLVCDTPPVQDLVFKDPSVRLKHCDLGNPNIPEWPRLYMDYTSPSGLCNHFSLGQAERMWSALDPNRVPSFRHRYNLYTSENLQRTGAGSFAPIIRANFWADRLYTCAGAPVQFLDYSMGQPIRFEWQFPGGTPATSTEAVPRVRWDTPGSYSVTLIVENRSGARDTITKTNFITVVPAARSLPFSYNFDGDQANFEQDWIVENRDAGSMSPRLTWTRSARANSYARTGERAGSMVMNFYNYSKYFEEDALISPLLNRAGIDSVGLSFDYSYSNLVYQNNTPKPQPGSSDRSVFARPFVYNDTLDVLVSTDCGVSWRSVWRKGGDELRTTARRATSAANGTGGDHNASSANEWRTENIDLTAVLGSAETFMVKFNAKSGFGNYLYVDEIRVRDTTIGGGVSRPTWADVLERSLLVAPNPTTGQTSVLLNLERPTQLSWTLYDLTGRRVQQQPQHWLPAGENELRLDLSGLPAGLYTLSLEADGRLFSRKVALN